MPGRYNRLKAKASSERGRRMARARWNAENARRELERPARLREMAEIESLNYPRHQGDAVGCLQYHDFATGKVTRWMVEIGDRRDRRVFRSPDGRRGKSAGWTFLLRCVRMVILGNFAGLKSRAKQNKLQTPAGV